jgi:hypothetical protein
MGTHIDSFFPHTVDRSVGVVLTQLSAVFNRLSNDLALIGERGRFSHEKGKWWLVTDGERIYGEGPNGFSISVYAEVVEFTSIERFGALEYPDLGIQKSLQRVFEAVASSLGPGGELAVAAGGLGDTDKAADRAAEGASFAEVCHCLEVVLGPPARSWGELELGSYRWYLESQAEQSTVPDQPHE